MFGLAKSLCMEQTNIHCRLLDVDSLNFDGLHANDIWGEKQTSSAAYRNMDRYIES